MFSGAQSLTFFISVQFVSPVSSSTFVAPLFKLGSLTSFLLIFSDLYFQLTAGCHNQNFPLTFWAEFIILAWFSSCPSLVSWHHLLFSHPCHKSPNHRLKIKQSFSFYRSFCKFTIDGTCCQIFFGNSVRMWGFPIYRTIINCSPFFFFLNLCQSDSWKWCYCYFNLHFFD